MSLPWTRRVLAGGALAAPFIRTAAAQQTLEWVAGSLGGGWYTMAAGLSSLIKDENPDIQIRVVPGGGLANATRVNRNTVADRLGHRRLRRLRPPRRGALYREARSICAASAPAIRRPSTTCCAAPMPGRRTCAPS